MDGFEIQLDQVYDMCRSGYDSCSNRYFSRDEGSDIRAFLMYAIELLQPEHFCKIIVPESGNQGCNPIVYVTKLGTSVRAECLSTFTKKSLKIKRTRDAVNCDLETRVTSYGIPLVTSDHSNNGRSFVSTEGGRPTLEVILLNGEKYTNDWEKWPNKIKSFQL